MCKHSPYCLGTIRCMRESIMCTTPLVGAILILRWLECLSTIGPAIHLLIRETPKVVCHMIRLIEAPNYRCLRHVRQAMGPFHVLVGPNASGKSTFLDVVAFLGEVMSKDPEAVIRKRSPNPRDLVWKHEGDQFELAVELTIPEALRNGSDEPVDTVRYQVAIGANSKTEKVENTEEIILLGKKPDLQDEDDSVKLTAITEHSVVLAPCTGKNTLGLGSV